MLKKQLQTNFGQFDYFDISYFEKLGSIKIKNTPYTIRVLLENCLRNSEKKIVNQDHLNLLSSWNPEKNTTHELKTNEIFKASDLMVDSLTQLLAREREKNKQNQ